MLFFLSALFPPGFAIYFSYGIINSSEANNKSPSGKYEPALQNKSPIYKGGPDESDMEAGSSPWNGLTQIRSSFPGTCTHSWSFTVQAGRN